MDGVTVPRKGNASAGRPGSCDAQVALAGVEWEAGVAIFTGDSGNDTLVGLTEHDTINGLGGNDSLSGLGGVDVINGGTGNDTIQGGPGSDSILAGADDDTVIHVFADNAGTADTYDGEGGTDMLRFELTSSELNALISDLQIGRAHV